MRKLLVAAFILFSVPLMADNGFFLKLSDIKALGMINSGITDLFGGKPRRFKNYTYFIEDIETNDKYWRVENLQYDGNLYNIIGWLDSNYPALPRYSYDFVKQFVPEGDV